MGKEEFLLKEVFSIISLYMLMNDEKENKK